MKQEQEGRQEEKGLAEEVHQHCLLEGPFVEDLEGLELLPVLPVLLPPAAPVRGSPGCLETSASLQGLQILGGALLEVLQVPVLLVLEESGEVPSHLEVLQVLEGAADEALLEVPVLQVLEVPYHPLEEELVGLLTTARKLEDLEEPGDLDQLEAQSPTKSCQGPGLP